MPDQHSVAATLERALFALTAGLLLALVPSALWGAPLAVTMNSDLAFGRFVGGRGVTGTVKVDASGSRSASGAVILLTGAPFAAAQFTITGNAGSRYALTLPTSFVMTSGTSQLSVSQLTASVPSSGVLPSAGSVTFTVGGTLTVSSTQGAGSYSGTFDVSVQKN